MGVEPRKDFIQAAMIPGQYLLLEDLGIGPAIVFSALQRQDIAFHVPESLVRLLPPAMISDATEFVFQSVAHTVVEHALEQAFYKGSRTCSLGPAIPAAVSG